MRPMIYLFIFLLVVGFTGVGIAATVMEGDANLDLESVREAIRLVENWDGHSVGSSGELGPYQILPSVWGEFSDKPLSWAYGRRVVEIEEQHATAGRIVDWIDAQLGALRLTRKASSIGLVWNAGYDNVRLRTVGRRHRGFADRVQNMYGDLQQRVVAQQPKQLFNP